MISTDFFLIGKNSKDKIAKTTKTEKIPNIQPFRGNLKRKKIRFKIIKRRRKRVLNKNALFSFSRRLKKEKRTKKKMRIIKEISPKMIQIFMG